MNKWIFWYLYYSFFQKESFKPFANEILVKSGENADEYVVVNTITIPSLGNVMQLGREDAFSLFFPKHQQLASELIEIFLGKLNYILIVIIIFIVELYIFEVDTLQAEL